MRRRISRFVTVGAIGFVLQLGALALLTQAVRWPYEPATALAVALAVLHNFWWHERWTWRDRTATGGLAGRIARYYVTTGATSIGPISSPVRLKTFTFMVSSLWRAATSSILYRARWKMKLRNHQSPSRKHEHE